jgi:hypothetical protein
MGPILRRRKPAPWPQRRRCGGVSEGVQVNGILYQLTVATGDSCGPVAVGAVTGAPPERAVVAAVRRVYEGRMSFHDGGAEIAAGISLHLIGVICLQVARVPTARGWVVLASDGGALPSFQRPQLTR